MTRPTINPNCHALRPLAEYSTRLPSSRRGKRINRATLFRWALKGVRGTLLETRMLGGCRYTCDAWVHDFMQPGPTLTPVSAGPSGPDVAECARIAQRFGVRKPGAIA